MNIRSVGAVLFHADGLTDERAEGQTDRRTDTHGKANSRFSQFYECASERLRLRSR
jgi:hypothetical protein